MNLASIEEAIKTQSLEFPQELNRVIVGILDSVTDENRQDVLVALLRSEYLHRMFWTGLARDKSSECYIERYTGWAESWCDNIILTSEAFADYYDMESLDVDEIAYLGGALGFDDNNKGPEREWVLPLEGFEIDRTMVVLAGQASDFSTGTDKNFTTMTDVFAYGGYEFAPEAFGPALLALALTGDPDIQEKWGFAVNDTSEAYVCEQFVTLSDAGTHWTDAQLNESFSESLSWKLLSTDAKEQLFELLAFGLQIDPETTFERGWISDASISKDSQHFLACMALCSSTPDDLLEELEALDDDLVTILVEK